MGDMLFSSRRTLVELAQGLRDSKTNDLNFLYEVLVQEKVLRICHDRVFTSWGKLPYSDTFPIYLFAANISSKIGEKNEVYCTL